MRDGHAINDRPGHTVTGPRPRQRDRAAHAQHGSSSPWPSEPARSTCVTPSARRSTASGRLVNALKRSREKLRRAGKHWPAHVLRVFASRKDGLVMVCVRLEVYAETIRRLVGQSRRSSQRNKPCRQRRPRRSPRCASAHLFGQLFLGPGAGAFRFLPQRFDLGRTQASRAW